MKKLISYITVGMAVFLLNLWFENASDTFYEKFINNFFSYKVSITVAMLFLIVIATVSIWNFTLKLKSDKIEKLQLEKISLEEQIQDGSRALWKYFKDINNLKTSQIIEDVMKDFIARHPNLLGIQIYEYSIKNFRNKRKIYVYHRFSEVADGIDLNAILKTEFEIENKLYKNYIKAKSNLESRHITEEMMDESLNFAITIIEDIQRKDLIDIDSIDSINLVYAELILDTIKHILGDNSNYISISDEARLEKLKRVKRTGILRGIEMQSEYIYENRGRNFKNGRQYITKIIEDNEYLHKRDYLILMTLNPIEDANNNLFFDLINEFHSELDSSLKVRYNNEEDNR